MTKITKNFMKEFKNIKSWIKIRRIWRNFSIL